MKKKIIPYDLGYVTDYLLKKNYQDFVDGTYTHYKKILNYIYPNLSDYYIRNIVLELIDNGFFEVRFYRGRRYFNIKTKCHKRDIGFITF